MVKKYLAFALFVSACLTGFCQENEVTRIPKVDTSKEYKYYRDSDKGFFIAGELIGGYSCRLMHSNFSFAELDVVGGYGFNEFFHLGIGAGARYYIDNNKVRYSTIKWAAPSF